MSPNIVPASKLAIEKCFSERGLIPVLANGKFISNSFGFVARGQEGACWKLHARFNVMLQYQDLNDRNFKYMVPILVADDEGFAGGWWKSQDV
jgi:hypothetical protein